MTFWMLIKRLNDLPILIFYVKVFIDFPVKGYVKYQMLRTDRTKFHCDIYGNPFPVFVELGVCANVSFSSLSMSVSLGRLASHRVLSYDRND